MAMGIDGPSFGLSALALNSAAVTGVASWCQVILIAAMELTATAAVFSGVS